MCVCRQDRRCSRHQTAPAEEEMQVGGSFQFAGKLPQSTGQNKYTENMTPGYTGKYTQSSAFPFTETMG